MVDISYDSDEAARALIDVLGDSPWNAVSLSKGYLEHQNGKSIDEAARTVYEEGPQTLKKSKKLIPKAFEEGLVNQFPERKRTGSAENPITKLFPATITEHRFLQYLDKICEEDDSYDYTDERHSGHTLVDFTLHQNETDLPINVKTATTKFRKSEDLVGLKPDDCIPIPAYKAQGAVEKVPSLVYVVSADYDLLDLLDEKLPELLSRTELICWDLLNNYAGSQIRDAEDRFVFNMVNKYSEQLDDAINHHPFHVISARKAIKILKENPERTPGIGMKAWGTGASAEVNIHVSIEDDMTLWTEVQKRIISNGVEDIIDAVNRKRMAEIYDPEI